MGNSPVAKVMCVNNTNLELATLDLEVTRRIIQVGQARVEVCNLIMKMFLSHCYYQGQAGHEASPT